ncbi:hypothetical protein CHCC15337_0798 [Bacillus paralicheniformis]|nr:hypothetical protein CHCC5027_1257 [Bacillus paralicheniformis]TWK37733.1 hypothetical protein CHCC20348_4499 [Bacillus paralicheniformis]TWL07926.1 hypothetical protein CHCC19468_4158 [Bacillus paralicheniformis]TWL20586.1 hypothetical protein CHCC19467_2918 [Bacillus paralicheniformis]TWL39787.1 hypothetical protein CHCC15337_0798 [Bacillus paralicheniformis]
MRSSLFSFFFENFTKKLYVLYHHQINLTGSKKREANIWSMF